MGVLQCRSTACSRPTDASCPLPRLGDGMQRGARGQGVWGALWHSGVAAPTPFRGSGFCWGGVVKFWDFWIGWKCHSTRTYFRAHLHAYRHTGLEGGTLLCGWVKFPAAQASGGALLCSDAAVYVACVQVHHDILRDHVDEGRSGSQVEPWHGLDSGPFVWTSACRPAPVCFQAHLYGVCVGCTLRMPCMSRRAPVVACLVGSGR
jgi:hypothetical protein